MWSPSPLKLFSNMSGAFWYSFSNTNCFFIAETTSRGQGVTVYLEHERRAMWKASDLHVCCQLGTSEDAQVRHMEHPNN